MTDINQLVNRAEEFMVKAPYLPLGLAKEMISALKEHDAPTVSCWISVKDRLPEKKGDYLIYNTDGTVWLYWYDKEYKEWYDSSGYLTESVTHWMPMPEAPKDGDG